MFASKSNRGFFDPQINDFIPDDAVEISYERHVELLTGQNEGKVIVWEGADGFPFLAEPPPPTDEESATVERAWRDTQLAATDSVVSRHRDELEAEAKTTLTAKQYTELQAYRRALRNWPEDGEFPLSEHRPATPEWLLTLPQ